jgi:hypothetical protein
MSKAIYMLVIAKGYTEAGYQLSAEERNELWAKVKMIDDQAGAKFVIACNLRWADEEVYDWAVSEYPDMDAYLKKAEELEELEKLEKLEWWRYVTTKTILGTKMEE